MPQYAVTRTGGGLPTSDYAIGLEQAFNTAESMRNQRRRNQQAANIMKQTMAAKGLTGTVDVADQGEIDAQADEASLKRFFGKDTLDDTDTTDNAMLSYIEQRNDFKKAPTFKQTIGNEVEQGQNVMAQIMAANQGTTDAVEAINQKQREIMNSGFASGNEGVNPIVEKNKSVMDDLIAKNKGVTPDNVEQLKQMVSNPQTTGADATQPITTQSPQPATVSTTQTATKPQVPPSGAIKNSTGSSQSEKEAFTVEAKGVGGIKSFEATPTVITQSTNGADYQDTMPYSMGTLLAQQGYRDAISAGAGDAVGMQMNPFNAMLRDKVASINNRNIAAQAANVVNTDVKQGSVKAEAGDLSSKLQQGHSSYTQMSINNAATMKQDNGPGGGKNEQPTLSLFSDNVNLNSKGEIENITPLKFNLKQSKDPAHEKLMGQVDALAKKVGYDKAGKDIFNKEFQTNTNLFLNDPDSDMNKSAFNELKEKGFRQLTVSDYNGKTHNFYLDDNGKYVNNESKGISLKDLVHKQGVSGYRIYPSDENKKSRIIGWDSSKLSGDIPERVGLSQATLGRLIWGAKTKTLDASKAVGNTSGE
jgi:hypothetical protein